MATAFSKFAEQTRPWRPAIVAAAVDCVHNVAICMDLQIYGYPTLLLFGDVREDLAEEHMRHSGAIAEGHPVLALRELWDWVLARARPLAVPVADEASLRQVMQQADGAGQATVLFVRSAWTGSMDGEIEAPETSLHRPMHLDAPPPLPLASVPPPPAATSFLDDLLPSSRPFCEVEQPNCETEGCVPLAECYMGVVPYTCTYLVEVGYPWDMLKEFCACR